MLRAAFTALSAAPDWPTCAAALAQAAAAVAQSPAAAEDPGVAAAAAALTTAAGNTGDGARAAAVAQLGVLRDALRGAGAGGAAGPACRQCLEPFASDSELVKTFMDGLFHPECFICGYCASGTSWAWACHGVLDTDH